MPNVSLERWLNSENCFLDMLQRLNIVIDVPSTLEYLKPSNILLDQNMMAHVCDFSIAKLFGEGETMVQTKAIATIGYMAPGNMFLQICFM